MKAMLAHLDAIEREMRTLGLWALEPPPADALASTAPFAHDAMVLEHWLQWIFLPRMRETVRRGIRPPSACNIHAFAAHSFVRHGVAARPVVQAICGFDEAFSEWVESLG
ncbi:MAG: YqcC family protein [Halothiobacillaceae bacterium]|nr:MAG: YqcC family protein [Halothiobacillaceae bacterium]